MRTFFIALMIIALFGCKLSTIKVVDKYPGGQTKTLYFFSDRKDTSNFTCIVYYENGEIKHETTISNDMFIGEKNSFYENGKLERKEKLYQPTPLDAEKYDCYIINYYSNGFKESEYQYRNDELNGLAIEYDSLGQKLRTTNYVNGKMNGRDTYYHSNGKISSIVERKNDSAYGYTFDFTELGDTLRAYISYGLSDNGIFYKKWLSDGRLLTGSYGDTDRSFVIWKWYDKNRGVLKSVTDKGLFTDSIMNRYIAPE